jgi:NADH-quinone oxidoreductase subunit N
MLIGMTVAQAGIAQGGAETTYGGVSALVFYVGVYTFASLGTFSAFSALGQEDREANSIDDLAGVARLRPLPAAALAVFMFSLAGIPPLAGFWGKFTLFSAAINLATNTSGSLSMWLIALAVIGVLNAAVAAAYYLRIIGFMYFQSSTATYRSEAVPGGALATTLACAILTLLIGFLPSYLLRATTEADQAVSRTLSGLADHRDSRAVPLVDASAP